MRRNIAMNTLYFSLPLYFSLVAVEQSKGDGISNIAPVVSTASLLGEKRLNHSPFRKPHPHTIYGKSVQGANVGTWSMIVQ
jgi:hypothetical protein